MNRATLSPTALIAGAPSATPSGRRADARASSAPGMWGRSEKEIQKRLRNWNRPIHQVRARIEKIFGTAKRSYGLRRMRWRGLAKAALQVRLTAIAYNLKRSLTINAARTA